MPKRAMVNEVEDERDGHQPGLPEDLQTQREDGASRNLVQKHSSDDLTALVESVGDSDTMETEISEEESQMRHQLSWSGQQFGLLRSGTEGDESGESRESIKAASRVKLNRIFDDNGNEIFLPIGILKSDGSPLDLGRVASDNALLNSRIKSKDQPTNAHLVGLVNSPSFDNFEESLRHSDFDENFHFTGPRTSSGTTSPPHSRLGSPTASYTSENTIFSLGLGWSPERAAVPIEGKIIKGPDQSATTKIAHDGCLPDEKIADRSTRYKLPQPLPEY
ncbi:hypothetical protein B484DRAFT_66802 [Ochromonadaceae sp. CCMP2298]|nr:hypothetical protein B484DRAFT_66802 [Ochromonadaceae sp. CCMP2298]